MKKRLIPKDYTYGIQNTIGGLICIIGTFTFLAVTNIFGQPIEITEWLKAAGPINAFGAIVVIIDQIKYRKVKEQRRQRERMMINQIPVHGKIEEIKRYRFDRHGRTSNTVEDSSKVVYQMVVSYEDPGDGMKKTTLSEYYSENLYTCLADDHVDVYVVGENGYVIIDGLRLRKFGEDKINLGYEGQGGLYQSDISFYIDIYGNVIATVISIIAIIAVIAIFMLR